MKDETKGLRYHHSAVENGYCRISMVGASVPYQGRFGAGKKIYTGRHNNSTQYRAFEYWIKPVKE